MNTLLSSVCFILAFSMCRTCNNAIHPKVERKELVSVDKAKKEITLRMIGNDTVTSSVGEVNLLLVNGTDSVYTTGQYYKIERFENGEWTEIPRKFGAFEDIGYAIKPNGGERQFTINLQNVKHTYRKGRYRICKRVNGGGKKRQLVYCNFYVE